MAYIEELETYDTLMEDLSDAVKEYMWSALFEDVSSTEVNTEDVKKKESIFKRFWNILVRIMKYIGRKLKEFATKVKKYIKSKKTIEYSVIDDCEVSTEIIAGIEDKKFSWMSSLIKDVGRYAANDMNNEADELEDKIKGWFNSTKRQLKAGTIMHYNILEKNLDGIINDHDRVTNEVEKHAEKLNVADTAPDQKYFTRVQNLFKSYQTYLTRIMNEMSDFMQNKICPYFRKYKVKGDIIEMRQ